MSQRAALLLLLATAACGQKVYDRYDGSAWPERRPQVVLPESGPAALITDNGSDTLSVVDLSGPSLIDRYPIGFDPIANDGPHHLALDEENRAVYIAYAYPPPSAPPGPHSNHGMSMLPGIVVKLSLDDLRVLAQHDTDLNPGDIVLTPDRTRVLVSHFNLAEALASPGADDATRRSTLRVFSAEDLTPLGTARVCIAPHGVAVSSDSRTAYVGCNGSDEMAIVALDQPGLPVERIPVGPGPGTAPVMRYGPYGVTLSPDGAFAYVNCLEGRGLRVFDIPQRRFLDELAVTRLGAAMFPAFGPGDATLLLPTQAPDGIARIRRDTMEVEQFRTFTREECELPHQAARGPDGRYYIVCEGHHQSPPRTPGALLTIDPTDLSTVSRVELGLYPDAVVFTTGRRP
jgi:hypothetical protein